MGFLVFIFILYHKMSPSFYGGGALNVFYKNILGTIAFTEINVVSL